MSARSALAEPTLAPPAGTARPIAVLALRRARHHRLDRRHGRREGWRGRTCLIAQRLRCRLAHGRAPARRFRGRRVGEPGGGLPPVAPPPPRPRPPPPLPPPPAP